MDIPMNIPYEDAQDYFSTVIWKQWNDEWKKSTETHLHKIRDSTFPINPITKLNRAEQVIK